MARNVITYIKKHLYPILPTGLPPSRKAPAAPAWNKSRWLPRLKADVDSFATYYYNWHFEKAARFCTPESKVWLRYAASNVHPADIELLKAKNEDAHIEIGDIDFKEDEVSATVNLEITNFLQMDTIGKEARLINKSKLTLPMTIHNGKWKVELKQLPTLQK